MVSPPIDLPNGVWFGVIRATASISHSPSIAKAGIVGASSSCEQAVLFRRSCGEFTTY
jgi:hypothetical protein